MQEWKQLPSRPDNHYFDTTTAVCACASLVGCVLPGLPAARPAPKPRQRVGFAAQHQAAKMRRYVPVWALPKGPGTP